MAQASSSEFFSTIAKVLRNCKAVHNFLKLLKNLNVCNATIKSQILFK